MPNQQQQPPKISFIGAVMYLIVIIGATYLICKGLLMMAGKWKNETLIYPKNSGPNVPAFFGPFLQQSCLFIFYS